MRLTDWQREHLEALSQNKHLTHVKGKYHAYCFVELTQKGLAETVMHVPLAWKITKAGREALQQTPGA